MKQTGTGAPLISVVLAILLCAGWLTKEGVRTLKKPQSLKQLVSPRSFSLSNAYIGNRYVPISCHLSKYLDQVSLQYALWIGTMRE